MLLQVAIVVLAILQLGASQQCGVVVMDQDQLKDQIRAEVGHAVAQSDHCTGNNTYQLDVLTSALHKEINATIENSMEKLAVKVEQLITPVLNEIHLIRLLGRTPSNPATSCRQIKEEEPGSPSGYYWVQSTNVPLVRVYCHMTKTCSGITGGWMRIANVNMANCTSTCPSGLKTLTSPKRLCSMNIDGPGCSSTSFITHGVEYTHVCGKVIGYQQKSPDAFWPYQGNNPPTIDEVYVDGVSITHGCSPRQHIWTLAAALHEVTTSHPALICPCTNIHNTATIHIPTYIGNDYFCDTASENSFQFKFYPDDPLWDGEGCGPLNACCAFNNPPWFMKELSSSTTDDIEMRLCADQYRSDEDITVEIIELYVR